MTARFVADHAVVYRGVTAARPAAVPVADPPVEVREPGPGVLAVVGGALVGLLRTLAVMVRQ